jgi:GTP 3',8-cyclase
MHTAAVGTLQTALSLSPALQSLKLNVVVMADVNLHELAAFAALTRDNALTVRFIEYMPFSGTTWNSKQMVSSRKVLDRLRESYPSITPVVSENAMGGAASSEDSTAKEYHIQGHQGSIGFISSMSDHFCATCTRLRITADGQLKVCLFDPREVSLRDIIRNETGSASNEKLLEVISAAVKRKKASHGGMDMLDRNKDANRSMIRIGLRDFFFLPLHYLSLLPC